jgi:hypothetical protein
MIAVTNFCSKQRSLSSEVRDHGAVDRHVILARGRRETAKNAGYDHAASQVARATEAELDSVVGTNEIHGGIPERMFLSRHAAVG